MANLFEVYKKKEPVNLFNTYQQPESTQMSAMDIAREDIKKRYPGVPDAIREGILSMLGEESHPNLSAAAKGLTNVTNYIPAALGGALQGASIPIRGVASLIPADLAQRFAQSPDLRTYFPQAEGFGQQTAQLGGELLGGGGLFGKILQGANIASKAANVPKALQMPTSLAATGAIATPGDAVEKAIGAGGALALGGAAKALGSGVEKLPKIFRGLIEKPNYEAAVEAAQKPHDKLSSTATEFYDQVRGAIKKRNISIPVNEEYLQKASEILANTRANKKLIEKAKSGDYQAIHDLQSHLYKKGTKGVASDDLALEKQGEEILALRNDINQDLENYLIKEGHVDIAHSLKLGRKTYAELMNRYFNKNLPKSISKLVHPELRKIPENPLKMFKENSIPMKEFLKHHPEIKLQLEKEAERQMAMDVLKKSIVTSGLGGGTIAGVKAISDLIS